MQPKLKLLRGEVNRVHDYAQDFNNRAGSQPYDSNDFQTSSERVKRSLDIPPAVLGCAEKRRCEPRGAVRQRDGPGRIPIADRGSLDKAEWPVPCGGPR